MREQSGRLSAQFSSVVCPLHLFVKKLRCTQNSTRTGDLDGQKLDLVEVNPTLLKEPTQTVALWMFTVGFLRHGWLIRDNYDQPTLLSSVQSANDFATEQAKCYCIFTQPGIFFRTKNAKKNKFIESAVILSG